MYISNLLKKVKSTIYKIFFLPFLRIQYLYIGHSSRVVKPLLITPKFISLGNFVRIRNGARIEGVAEYMNKKFKPCIQIDDYVTIEQNLHLTCASKVYIGRNTAIAANVTITDIHHPYNNIHIPIEKQDIITLPVSIDEDCKIYNNAVLLPGTKIGKHCTIGANSVVSGIYPNYCVIVGCPAKIIKRYSFKKQEWLKTDNEGNFLDL